MQERVYAAVASAIDRGEAAALVTIVATRGSTPQRVGAKLLVYGDGRTVGTIGGGCYENDACLKARECLRTRRAALFTYDLSDSAADDNGLICGGQMQVFIEPIEPSPSLYIAGAGHVSQPIARMAAMVGFRVHVLDDRAKFADAERFPDAQELIVAPIADWLAQADLPESAFVVVVTRGHTHDLGALRALAGRRFRYVGMIGSRAKVATVFEALAADGVAGEWLAGVRAPIGLRIGAITPEEIAVSIVAELVAVRRGVTADPDAAPVSMRQARTGT